MEVEVERAALKVGLGDLEGSVETVEARVVEEKVEDF